jgi:ureidoglycolate hydrolase
MDEKILEVREHSGEGYKPLVDYGSWRVAILRFQDRMLPEHQSSMERHLETDEVFVLTKGNALIILGGSEPQVGALTLRTMEIGKIYNIRKNAWHTLSISREASVVIVENQNTSKDNSEYAQLSQEQREWIQERAGSEVQGWNA